MINLLPTESKRQLRAARNNALLVRYIIVVIIAGLFANFILVGSYTLLTRTKESQDSLIEASTSKAQAYSQTQTEINRLSVTLSGARTLLDQQVMYSHVLRNIGSSLTSGTIVDKIDLSSKNFVDTPLTLKVNGKDNQSIAQLRTNLSSVAYFSNVTIDNISETGGVVGYPVSATLTLKLTKVAGQ